MDRESRRIKVTRNIELQAKRQGGRKERGGGRGFGVMGRKRCQHANTTFESTFFEHLSPSNAGGYEVRRGGGGVLRVQDKDRFTGEELSSCVILEGRLCVFVRQSFHS